MEVQTDAPVEAEAEAEEDDDMKILQLESSQDIDDDTKHLPLDANLLAPSESSLPKPFGTPATANLPD